MRLVTILNLNRGIKSVSGIGFDRLSILIYGVINIFINSHAIHYILDTKLKTDLSEK